MMLACPATSTEQVDALVAAFDAVARHLTHP
jgi:hypothetical protein